MVSGLDVVPTILRATDLETEGSAFDGIDLLQYIVTKRIEVNGMGAAELARSYRLKSEEEKGYMNRTERKT